MFKRILFGLAAMGVLALAGCGSAAPVSDADYYDSRVVTIDRSLPNGDRVRCFMISGYPESLSCVAGPATR